MTADSRRLRLRSRPALPMNAAGPDHSAEAGRHCAADRGGDVGVLRIDRDVAASCATTTSARRRCRSGRHHGRSLSRDRLSSNRENRPCRAGCKPVRPVGGRWLAARRRPGWDDEVRLPRRWPARSGRHPRRWQLPLVAEHHVRRPIPLAVSTTWRSATSALSSVGRTPRRLVAVGTRSSIRARRPVPRKTSPRVLVHSPDAVALHPAGS